MLDRIDAGVTLRRAARRIRRHPGRAPARPLGVKLELTHSCNLRCGFCYTDSPRHTLARTPDLDDATWRDLVEQSIDLGIIEAVVTGGEPLMRRELALELLERLDEVGVGVTLNTNGWFIDDELADRMAKLRGLSVRVSVDGACAATHDAARGVPGSWRRAVEAVDRLLARGVRVQSVNVVTPDNRSEIAALMEAMWMLGLSRVRLAPVVQLGAAGRSGRWQVARRPIETQAREFERRHGGRISVPVLNPTASVASQGDKAPAAILIRPDGTARMESSNPFAFGNAASDGIAACWERMAAGWSDPQIRRWARGLGDAEELHSSPLLPYRDADMELTTATDVPTADGVETPTLPPLADPGPADPERDRAFVRRLALSRRYRLGPLREGTDLDGSRVVRVTDARRVVRINRTAALIMEACDDGTAGAAIERVAEAHPGVSRDRVEEDVLGGLRDLLAKEIVRPALAPGAASLAADEPATADLAL